MDIFYCMAIAILLFEFLYIRYLTAQLNYQKAVNERQKEMMKKAFYEIDFEKVINEPHGSE